MIKIPNATRQQDPCKNNSKAVSTHQEIYFYNHIITTDRLHLEAGPVEFAFEYWACPWR